MEANLAFNDLTSALERPEIGKDSTHHRLACVTSSAWASPGLIYGAAGIDQIADSVNALQRAIIQITETMRSQGDFGRNTWVFSDVIPEASDVKRSVDWESIVQRIVAQASEAVESRNTIVHGTCAPSAVTPEATESEKIYNVIESLYVSKNRPRDRQIAERIIALHRGAIEEDERILSASLQQFANFFLAHPDLSLPKIVLTPNGSIRVRWIQGAGSFVAIEFTGKPLVQMMAEIPREGGQTARYFSAMVQTKIRRR
jgi:hypothetical protein